MHGHRCGVARRDFLKAAGTAAVGLGFGAPLGVVLGRDTASSGPASADVGLGRGSNMEEAVKRAVKLAGGLGFIKPDQTVLIKPNVTGALKSPTTTNPEVLYAVIKLVAEQGPKRIIVADRSFSPQFVTTTPTTLSVMEKVGHIDAVNQAKSEVKAPVVAVGLEAAEGELELLGKPKDTPMWRRIKPEKAVNWPNGFELAELLFAVDHVINVPVIKTHFQAWFTMSMKAFVGMSHHRTRREFHGAYVGDGVSLMDQKRTSSRRRGIKKDIAQEAKEVAPFVNRLAELNLGLRPAMNIMDGSKSFVFGGPSNGDTAEPKVVVASTDRIAADATGVAVLKAQGTEDRLQKCSVWDTPFLKHGVEIGLGIDSVKKLNLKAEGVPDAELETIKKMLV
jgi:uncharacterized protein (DUF362 family)